MSLCSRSVARTNSTGRSTASLHSDGMIFMPGEDARASFLARKVAAPPLAKPTARGIHRTFTATSAEIPPEQYRLSAPRRPHAPCLQCVIVARREGCRSRPDKVNEKRDSVTIPTCERPNARGTYTIIREETRKRKGNETPPALTERGAASGAPAPHASQLSLSPRMSILSSHAAESRWPYPAAKPIATLSFRIWWRARSLFGI